ncbi:phenylacetate-CoA oxygenase subunit PaaC [Terrimonas sp. NA20]|uniref:Phenylacetate-CoA oxygenase subunit PaaC n=1 Tax=Terrimonas ginsenosidimutans TaxID=2908004 RepID=A0ABS9KUW7_9BACT|nr:1,2-phenylacetyl-CoA epoxidase subunit PaaC [Terrimonas ginsenosidimutans]MCG2616115.1 phenylacetate-CoA oxygenase subunit PaaC [Terrimonas ginsenosidimutans]
MSLLNYSLSLADSTLLLGQRNSEWCGHGPVLEQDIAITNISLDLIGQARNFYQYAAIIRNDGSTEDTLAYLRDAREFRNLLLVELPNGDWGSTILRQFFFSNYQHLLYTKLQQSNDEQLAAIAAKALKEVTYHLRWSSEWVIRLGDGTAESHRRMNDALQELWPYTGEMFIPVPFEKEIANKQTAPDPGSLKDAWMEKTAEIFHAATLDLPGNVFMHTGGKEGNHTEHIGFVLAEMQFLQRAYPGAEW